MRRVIGGEQQPVLRHGDAAIGERACWGQLGYSGEAYAPAEGTYPGIDVVHLAYTTVQDSGRYPNGGCELANLYPLVAAALYDVGFALEAGPLATWEN